MVRVFFIAIVSFLYLAALYVSALLFKQGHIMLGLTSVTIIIATGIIFIHPKAYPFRFMYPGIITFILFLFIPIIFTIYIGFTNLSTGHFLSHEQTRNILVNETYIKEDSRSKYRYKYLLYKLSSKNSYHIELENRLYASFVLADNTQEIILSSGSNSSIEKEVLSKGEIFDLKDNIKKMVFLTPDGYRLKYYRTDFLAPLNNRYTEVENQGLKDNIDGKVYYPDHNKGFYSSKDGIHIAPGFHVSVGFSNFITLIKDKGIRGPFIKIFIWTFVWAILSVVLAFSLGMFLALIVNSKGLALRPVYRVLLIIPYSIPFFISMLIFKGMYNKDFGIINDVLTTIGITTKINWLGDPIWAKVSCLLVNLWLGFPYMFLVTTGILQSIPESVYEAAKLDGAKRIATFRKITLPMIFSAIAPLLVGTFAFNFNNFVGIYLLTGGGPPIEGATTAAGETDILLSYTYKLAFEGGMGQHFGLASSVSILVFFIIAIITLINFKLSGILDENKTVY